MEKQTRKNLLMAVGASAALLAIGAAALLRKKGGDGIEEVDADSEPKAGTPSTKLSDGESAGRATVAA